MPIAFPIPLLRIVSEPDFCNAVPTLVHDSYRQTFLIFSCDLGGFTISFLSHLTHLAVCSPDKE